EAVHREVDLLAEQRLLDLPDEQSLAAHHGQPRVRPPVALGPHGDDLDLGPAGAETVGHLAGLDQGQRTAPCAEADHVRRPRPNSSWTSSSSERLEPAREDSRSLVMGACRILLTMAVDSASIAARCSGEASPIFPSVRFTSARRISSRRARSDTMVGTTSTSPW